MYYINKFRLRMTTSVVTLVVRGREVVQLVENLLKYM